MENKRVLVGMSGGVDSAAAAVLLREAGYEPVGCTLHLYDNEDIGQSRERGCCSLEDVEDARSVAHRLGMDFYVFNFKDLFRREVMDDFVRCYLAGRTPNPCIQCNRHIKFTALLRRADELDIPCIATGHYARVDYDRALGRWRLLRGLDRRKDQSYVLYPLTQSQLSRLLLPVGGYEKPAVRALAEERGLVNARKPDSPDICFVLYVVRKEAASNAVVLGDEVDLYSRTVWAESFNWVSLPPQEGPIPVTAKTRYSQTEASGVLYPEGDGRVRMVFDQPQRAVTAGQSLVAYQGDAVAGGGIICRAEP